MLEAVAEGVEKFSHSALKHWAALKEIARLIHSEKEVSESRYASLLETEFELFNSYKEVTSAEAKLLLLGEKECQRVVREYGDYVKIYRAESLKNKKMTVQFLDDYRKKLLEKREAFFNCLSSAYKRGRT